MSHRPAVFRRRGVDESICFAVVQPKICYYLAQAENRGVMRKVVSLAYSEPAYLLLHVFVKVLPMFSSKSVESTLLGK